MKAAILTLVLAAPIAHAEKWLEYPNKAGGKIILFANKCRDETRPALHAAMATIPSGQTLHGCWGLIAGDVHIVYEDGTTYSYPSGAFTLVDTDQPKNKYNY
jgi:hypothetical protein